MTRKILSLLFALILCGANCAAQDVVDFVNAYYVKAYIDKKTDAKIVEKHFKAEYERLKANSYENPLSEDELQTIIGKLPTFPINNENVQKKTHDFFLALQARIVADKNNIEQLIELPEIYEKWKKLEASKKALKAILKKKMKINPADDKNAVADTEKSEGERIGAVESDNPAPETDAPSSNFLTPVIWLVIIGLIGVLVFHFRKEIKHLIDRKLNKNENKQEIDEDDDADADEITDYQAKCKELQGQLKELENKISKLSAENNRLRESNASLLQSRRNEPPRFVAASAATAPEQDEPVTQLFAVSINNEGIFTRASQQAKIESVFILNLSDKTAKFTVNQDAYGRVLSNPNLLDGCDIQRTTDHPVDLEIEEGDAIYTDLGEWKVINPARIRFV
jgi:hypothetical protein